MTTNAPTPASDLATAKVDVPAGLSAPVSADGGPALLERFEAVYADAHGEAARVPWADCRCCPMLTEWLNAEAPLLVRPGSRAVVVGCGLGDDVVELAERGYDVLGFDIAPTAVRWASLRHPQHAARFVQADLLSLPARMQRRFDLVIEVYTIQSMPPGLRQTAARALASLLAPRGVLLAVCRGRTQQEPLEQVIGPPWPLTCAELYDVLSAAGLYPVQGEPAVIESFDGETPPKRRLRGAFTRV